MTPPLEIRRILCGSIRLYLAPLVGAIKGVRAELRRADRALEHDRQAGKGAPHRS